MKKFLRSLVLFFVCTYMFAGPISDLYSAPAINSVEHKSFFKVIQDESLFVNATNTTNASCNETSDGSIQVNVIGGTPPYNYELLNFSTTATEESLENTFTNLFAGTYSVRVTDSEGVVGNSDVIRVWVSNPITIKTTVINSCFGQNDGKIFGFVQYSSSNETSEYSLDGTTYSPSGSFTNLAPGTYTVYAKNQNGCTASTEVTIEEEEEGFNCGLTKQSPFTQADGFLTCTSSGIEIPYFDICNPDYEEIAIEKTPDMVSIRLQKQLILEPNNPISEECPEYLDYYSCCSLDEERDNFYILGLSMENSYYKLTVNYTDGTTEIFYAASFSRAVWGETIVSHPTSQNSEANGTITFEPYSWAENTTDLEYQLEQFGTVLHPWQSANTFGGLSAGNYTVQVRNGGCNSTLPVVLREVSNEPLSASVELTNDSGCNGTNNGKIEVTATGGSQPYIYELFEAISFSSISSGTSNTFQNLGPGIYFVVVTDANSDLVQSGEITISEAPMLDAVIETTCYGNNGVTANIEATGGSPPYEFSIDGGVSFQSSGTFENLDMGSYLGAVRDTNGCVITVALEIENMECPDFTLPVDNFILKTTGESCSSGNNGSIAITASEHLNYSASITGEGINTSVAFTDTTTFEQLSAGGYQVCITVSGVPDYQKCFSLQIEEPEPLSVFTDTDPSGKIVALKLVGGNNYIIDLNGKTYTTAESEISLPLSKVENRLSVKTDLECQGTYEQTILVLEEIMVYPNPIKNGDITIILNDSFSGNALLSIFANDGRAVRTENQEAANGKIRLNMEGLPLGIYTLKVKTDTQSYTRRVIKK